ncbi:MAG TPA: hypothetical protein VN736_19635 [Candidatus Limnocylindrales bacterium]|nr:hypothetical protein [Candidatus Limnocylindrales bacterium]
MKKLLLAISAFALVAAAQSDEVQMKAAKTKAEVENLITRARVIGVNGTVMGPTVKGAPYAAEEVHENTQTLADGTKIHNEDKTKVFRDSEGRVRRESGDEVSVFDPTNGTSFVRKGSINATQKQQLNTVFLKSDAIARSATASGEGGGVAMAGAKGGRGGGGVTTLSAPGGAYTSGDNVGVAIAGAKGGRGGGVTTLSAPGGAYTLVLRPGDGLESGDSKNVKTEALGTQSFDGILAEGTRTTTTIPAGTIGNDRPIEIVNERWYSPDLQVTVMTKRADPRTGEEVTRLNNIRRGEQDPSLFQTPQMKTPHEM